MAEFTARQTHTQSVILPYSDTKGIEAVELYEQSGREAIEWQELLTSDIMATNEEGLWTHLNTAPKMVHRANNISRFLYTICVQFCS